jgi:leucyl aminopeptidase
MKGRSPGADDDGSGTTTIIEAYRLLIKSGYVPASPLEFHFYSAEEAGLLGSQKIAAAYKKAGAAIKGAFQVDMTGYVKAGTTPGMSLVLRII